MPRKPEGDRPLTGAQREARRRQRRASEASTWRSALEVIRATTTDDNARQIAAMALNRHPISARQE